MGRRTKELSEMSMFFAEKNVVGRTRRDNLLLHREDDKGAEGKKGSRGTVVDCIISVLIAVVYIVHS